MIDYCCNETMKKSNIIACVFTIQMRTLEGESGVLDGLVIPRVSFKVRSFVF